MSKVRFSEVYNKKQNTDVENQRFLYNMFSGKLLFNIYLLLSNTFIVYERMLFSVTALFFFSR